MWKLIMGSGILEFAKQNSLETQAQETSKL